MRARVPPLPARALLTMTLLTRCEITWPYLLLYSSTYDGSNLLKVRYLLWLYLLWLYLLWLYLLTMNLLGARESTLPYLL